MDNISNLESGYKRSTGVENITFTDLRTSPQEDFSLPWTYNTPHIHGQPVRNREHVRLLIASIDENLAWVTFEVPTTIPRLFTQAAWRGDGFCNVEVNVPEGGWVQSVLRDGSHEISDITSENFGNMDMFVAREQFSTAEAFMLCSLWMDQQIIPEGFTFGPIEE